MAALQARGERGSHFCRQPARDHPCQGRSLAPAPRAPPVLRGGLAGSGRGRLAPAADDRAGPRGGTAAGPRQPRRRFRPRERLRRSRSADRLPGRRSTSPGLRGGSAGLRAPLWRPSSATAGAGPAPHFRAARQSPPDGAGAAAPRSLHRARPDERRAAGHPARAGTGAGEALVHGPPRAWRTVEVRTLPTGARMGIGRIAGDGGALQVDRRHRSRRRADAAAAARAHGGARRRGREERRLRRARSDAAHAGPRAFSAVDGVDRRGALRSGGRSPGRRCAGQD